MRRLATQNRGGSVQSNRDYQSIVNAGNPELWTPVKKGLAKITLTFLPASIDGPLVAVGGYLACSTDTEISITLADESGKLLWQSSVSLDSHRHWNRLGKALLNEGFNPAKLTLEIVWTTNASIWVWGLTCGIPELPEPVRNIIFNDPANVEFIDKPHLAPEAFYFPHLSPIDNCVERGAFNASSATGRRSNPAKKCSQCQRVLPVDPKLADLRMEINNVKRAPQNMVLAFHGHKAKATGYQNECRACKKFEINDHFNPIRSSDQLHESSTLTRERKLLLREGEILKQFKDRDQKFGLRSLIWKRFDQKCFKCHTPVSVESYQLDHTRPLAYLWPLDEFATCLCSTCNNQKKDHFPVDFYNRSELIALSEITKLPLADLRAKKVNDIELKRIRADIVEFATSWSARLFNSVARRVKETKGDIDLFEELRSVDPELLASIMEDLSIRPAGLTEEDLD